MGRLDEMYRDELQPRAVTVFFYLFERSNKDSICFPSIRTIARDTKLSFSTVKRAIEDLEKSGYIEKERRFRRNGAKSSNLYTIKK